MSMISGFDCLAEELNLIAAFLSFSPHTQFKLASEAVITEQKPLTHENIIRRFSFEPLDWRGLVYNLIEKEPLTVGVFCASGQHGY